MRYRKIINDPVYGFISIPDGLIFDIIEHPYFQRLRFIKQVGLTHYVYPGALHTRFHHALGAMHLALRTVDILRNKGITINDEEKEALAVAMLLHDIGHGPFSHALEYSLVNVSHEELSVLIMKALNTQFKGALELALQMYLGTYSRKFFRQLIRSQLDLDRLDYLSRDAFFTGVTEGQIAYDRILHMLNVRSDSLVVEEKGIYSVEKFLIARRLMYWQVYLHKTVLSAEQMLIKTIERIKFLLSVGKLKVEHLSIHRFLSISPGLENFQNSKSLLNAYCELDDLDIGHLLKIASKSNDQVLSHLSKSLIYRRLFKLEFVHAEIGDLIEKYRLKERKRWGMDADEIKFLVFGGKESNIEYSTNTEEILILRKNETVEPISSMLDFKLSDKTLTKSYICYPKQG